MSSIHTLALKMTYNSNTFTRLRLAHDTRHGRDMPWLVDRAIFLEDARALPRPEGITPRAWARELFYTAYGDFCPTHGNALHHTSTGRCSACREVPADRGPTYVGHCDLHGDVAFSSARRLCLSCYNTLGKPRPASTNPLGFYLTSSGEVRQSPT